MTGQRSNTGTLAAQAGRETFPLAEGLVPGNQSVAIFPAKNDVKPWPVAAHASDGVRRATLDKTRPSCCGLSTRAAQQIGKKLLIGGQQGCVHITPCAHRAYQIEAMAVTDGVVGCRYPARRMGCAFAVW